MMRYQMVSVAVGMLFFSLFIGCGKQNVVVEDVPQITLTKHDSSRIAVDRFIKARDYERRRLYSLAADFYKEALRFDPDSDYLRERLADIYIMKDENQKALDILMSGRSLDELSDDQKRRVSNILLVKGKVNEAVGLLSSIREKKTSELKKIGYIYERTNQPDSAFKYYRRYVDEETESKDVQLRSAELYLKSDSLAQAKRIYEECKEDTAYRAEAYTGLGRISLMNGDTAEAESLFVEVLKSDTGYDEAAQRLSGLYVSKGEFKEAIKVLKSIEKENEVSGKYHKQTLAMLYQYDGQYEKAEELYKELLSDDMNNYFWHYKLGNVYYNQENYKEAEEELRKGIALKDDYAGAYKSLFFVYLDKEDYKKALGIADSYISSVGDSVAGLNLKAMALTRMERFEKAGKLLEISSQLDSLNLDTWFHLGSVYERMDKFQKAEECFKYILYYSPDHHASLNYLGYMWAEKGKKLDSAKAMIESALKQRPDNSAYLDSYAWVFYQQGDYDSAYYYIKKALNNSEPDPVIIVHHGDILSDLGRCREAVEAYNNAIEAGYDEAGEIRKKIKKLVESECYGE